MRKAQIILLFLALLLVEAAAAEANGKNADVPPFPREKSSLLLLERLRGGISSDAFT